MGRSSERQQGSGGALRHGWIVAGVLGVTAPILIPILLCLYGDPSYALPFSTMLNLVMFSPLMFGLEFVIWYQTTDKESGSARVAGWIMFVLVPLAWGAAVCSSGAISRLCLLTLFHVHVGEARALELRQDVAKEMRHWAALQDGLPAVQLNPLGPATGSYGQQPAFLGPWFEVLKPNYASLSVHYKEGPALVLDYGGGHESATGFVVLTTEDFQLEERVVLETADYVRFSTADAMHVTDGVYFFQGR